MSFLADALTVFAVLIPALGSEWATPTWIAIALVCVCAWVLIAADIRHPRNSDGDGDPSAAMTPRPGHRKGLLF